MSALKLSTIVHRVQNMLASPTGEHDFHNLATSEKPCIHLTQSTHNDRINGTELITDQKLCHFQKPLHCCNKEWGRTILIPRLVEISTTLQQPLVLQFNSPSTQNNDEPKGQRCVKRTTMRQEDNDASRGQRCVKRTTMSRTNNQEA
jgi:hypothetical protein